MTMIKVEHLKKSFGKKEVLKDISANVEKGKVISIIGPSGSGKSTFLRCLNVLETPTSGKIIFDGQDLTHISEKELDILNKCSMLAQYGFSMKEITELCEEFSRELKKYKKERKNE